MLDTIVYQSIFAGSPIGACILSASENPIILDANEAFLRNVGQARAHVIGQPLFHVFPDAPDDAGIPGSSGVMALRMSLAQVIASGKPHALPTQRYPVRTPGPDGVEQFVERFWNATSTPIFDAAGQLLCIHHVTIEVTEQKRAEEALRLSRREALAAAREAEAGRARLGAVLQAAPVGIVMADANGKVLESNAAHDALWCRHGLPSSRPLDFAEWKGWWADGSARHGQPVAGGEWPLALALRGETSEPHLIEIETFDAARERRIVVCSAAPVRGPEGAIDAAVVVLLDMTERLRAEAALREADRRKDEFLAMLAHELRNPLAPIMAAAELLAQKNAAPDTVSQASGIIARQARHLTGLVDDLLDVSRVTRGLVVIDRGRVDLGAVVAEAIEQVQPLVASRGHRLEVNVQEAPLVVPGDGKRLMQVVANLLNNAAKYTPPGGRIRVQVRAEQDQARILVSDNGIGMSRQLIGRAFELFAQAERDADRVQGGLGIGLAVVQRLVELHGGRVEAHSQGPGQGSSFAVWLPLARDGAANAQPPAVMDASPGAVQRLRVTIVDDNRDGLEMLSMMVRHFGHEVDVAHTAAEVLEAAQRTAGDVYLLDIGLPGMDGFELARRLRRDARTAQAVLVAVTGYGGEEARRRAIEAGFDHHFVKPVKGGELRLLLRDLARARGRLLQERRTVAPTR
ncbi:PAS domain-containing hybrid sensor histidine kinase/response regulator [Telluria sp. B2]